MASQQDVRRIALALPKVEEGEERFVFSVRNGGKRKDFVWSWLERVHPKKARVPSETVIGIRVASLDDKEALLATGDEKFFTEPHYNGYPAILVRLPLIEVDELAELIEDGWRCQAPAAELKKFHGSAGA